MEVLDSGSGNRFSKITPSGIGIDAQHHGFVLTSQSSDQPNSLSPKHGVVDGFPKMLKPEYFC